MMSITLMTGTRIEERTLLQAGLSCRYLKHGYHQAKNYKSKHQCQADLNLTGNSYATTSANFKNDFALANPEHARNTRWKMYKYINQNLQWTTKDS
jgi:hypothetical protein